MSSEHNALPCRRCRAPLTYTPGQNELVVCRYCGESQPLDAAPPPEPTEYQGILEARFEHGPREELATLRCGSCGAETTRPAEVISDRCPFCDSPAVVGGAKLRAPDGVLPFSVDEARARAALAAWDAALWFSPGRLLPAQPSLRALYLPYWSFDWDVSTGYLEFRKNGNRAGDPKSIRTKVEGATVLASASVPPMLGADLEPWEVEQIVAPDPRFLLGVRAETHGPRAGLERGAALSHRLLDREIDDQLGLDGPSPPSIEKKSRRYHAVNFRLLLLPVWSTSYLHGDKSHRVLVNGSTGEVVGERPVVTSRMVLAGASCFALPLIAGVVGVVAQGSFLWPFWLTLAVQSVLVLRTLGKGEPPRRPGRFFLRRPGRRGTENLAEVFSRLLQADPEARTEAFRFVGFVGLFVSIAPLLGLLVGQVPLLVAFHFFSLAVGFAMLWQFHDKRKQKRHLLGLDDA